MAPAAAAGSIVFTPELSRAALRMMYARYSNRIWGRYGFSDAFNVERDWWDQDVIGRLGNHAVDDRELPQWVSVADLRAKRSYSMVICVCRVDVFSVSSGASSIIVRWIIASTLLDNCTHIAYYYS